MTAGRGGDRGRALTATAGGLGLLPGAPGTFGSLLAVGLYVFLAAVRAGEPVVTVTLAGGLLLASAGTVALGSWAERFWGRKDPQQFVLDEVAGTLLVFLAYRVGTWWQVLAWGWPLTRLMDILKPFPARTMERLSVGWGVLLDDLVSAAWTVGLLYLLAAVSGPLGFARAIWAGA